MELATALIWTLRIVLPIILFCIYFKFQSPKDENESGSTAFSYSRTKLLAVRKASLQSDGVPAAFANVTLVDAAKAPALFSAPGRGSRGGNRREDRAPRGERHERREKRELRKPDKVADNAEPEAAPVPENGTSEDKMHLESLLNYVAFNRKEQQRTFLPDEAGAPPPPPPKPANAPIGIVSRGLAAPGDGTAKSGDTTVVSGVAAEKANAEAQMVLRGAINFKRADVAKNLYDKLRNSRVEITERTFTLMIQACVFARDLKSASDFLMKMESTGYCPDTELLDKVMDLYSEQKIAREQEKQAMAKDDANASPAEAPAGGDSAMDSITDLEQAAMEEVLNGVRAKLSKDAPIFVPMLATQGPPPPPPPPPTAHDGVPVDDTMNLDVPQQRTALCATAKPFQPQLLMNFDPYTYTWSVDHNEPAADDAEYAEGIDGSQNPAAEKARPKGKAKASAKKHGSVADTDKKQGARPKKAQKAGKAQ